MLPVRVLVVVAITLAAAPVLAGCAHARASRWERSGAYTVCTCDGTERQPTPSEADEMREGERVDVYCEGKVRDCRPGELRGPRHRGYNAPMADDVLD